MDIKVAHLTKCPDCDNNVYRPGTYRRCIDCRTDSLSTSHRADPEARRITDARSAR